MARYYKAPNKRIIHRGLGGQFRKSTLQDLGIPACDVQKGKARCAGCGHEWFPILVTGVCPECGSQEKTPPEWSAEVLEMIEEYRGYSSGMIDPRDKEKWQRIRTLECKLREVGYL